MQNTDNDSGKEKTWPDSNHKNEKIVRDFVESAFNRKDLDALKSTVGDVYIQHNPMVADGRDSVRAMLQIISPKVVTIRTLSEGDYVVAHNRSTGWGDGKEHVSFDIFRIEDDKIVEHWDVVQEIVDKTVSGRSQTDGTTRVLDIEKTAANKKLVQGFLDDCVYGNHWDRVSQYINDRQYDQHNPSVGDGLSGFGEAMKNMAEHGLSMRFEKTYRVIADGNFVFVHSRGEFGGKPVAFADLMRLEDGKIVEHWDAIQPVGALNKSGHDMFEQIT